MLRSELDLRKGLVARGTGRGGRIAGAAIRGSRYPTTMVDPSSFRGYPSSGGP